MMYKTARNHAKNILRLTQKTHGKFALRDSEKYPNKFWKMIKTIFPTKTKHRYQMHSQQEIHC